MKYSAEELELLESIENSDMQSVAFDNDKIKQMAKKTREYNQEKKQISINLKRSDLDMVKQRADAIGISYQNIIQALVHNYTTNKISLTI
jgi:predicted DNA binding CopG/RHH family protein